MISLFLAVDMESITAIIKCKLGCIWYSKLDSDNKNYYAYIVYHGNDNKVQGRLWGKLVATNDPVLRDTH